MSVDEQRERGAREPASWTVAGYMAALALFASAVSLVWKPGRVGPGAMLIALIAAAIGGPHRRLAGLAVAAATLCWFAGMVFAILTDQPIW